MLKRPTWILLDGRGDVLAYTGMEWRRTCAPCPHIFVPYPLRKFRLTLSLSYWWIWHISILMPYHIFSADYVSILIVYIFPFYFVSTPYPVLSPTVSILYFILNTSVSILDFNSPFLYPTLTTFPTQYLV